ncbi:MAG: hypothetical protein P4M04_03945, partial [Acidobacteriota bacterium]|nr:hypothetical protein [Acidobacteriota bacterium]
MVAVEFALAGIVRTATALLVFSSLLAIVALQIFSRPRQAAKTKGVHISFPLFVRSAYVWLIIAGSLGVWAANATNPLGIW